MPVRNLRTSFRAGTEWMPTASVAAVGILGLSGDFWLRRDLASLIDVHALFGASLALFIIFRFHARMRALSDPQISDIRRISRHLSRAVYLLLGLLVVFKEFATPGNEYLGDYLVYALASLVLIRLMALAFRWRSRNAHRALE